MSTPPLPEVFGNYVLGDFVEVVSPHAVSWLPQTAGWAWLGGLLLLWLLRYSWRSLRHWYHNRYRREAVARLQQIASGTSQESMLIELNKLLKLTALSAFSREQVASLSGEAWVDFLDAHCAAAPFSGEQRQLLAHGPYKTGAIENKTQQHLIDACRNWIRNHENPAHV